MPFQGPEVVRRSSFAGSAHGYDGTRPSAYPAEGFRHPDVAGINDDTFNRQRIRSVGAGTPRCFGIARFQPVPVLHAQSGGPAGGFEGWIGGRPGWRYRVESSTDLVEWKLVRELPSTGALTPFKDPETAPGTSRFYRTAVMPP